ELAGAEELQARRLAAQLVEGVVEVGQVLDLGDREETDVRRPLRNAQDRGFVQESVEDATGPESALEAVGHVVDAALATDVLTEQDHLRPPAQLVGKGGVQAAG